MPSDRFEFDENGDTFFCFFISFYTLLLIPVTYFFWPTSDSKDIYEQGKRKCMCQPCQVKRHNLKLSTPWRKLRKLCVKSAFALAWVMFFLMVYKLTLMEKREAGFDPFLQLEISRDASPREIRHAYKQLSIKYHPDRGGDPKRFILISKAYSALTNEESRKNWEEYGNPDGPRAAQFGIALPKWIVEKENFYLVIGAYVLLFMLILPLSVGMWWYNTMKFSNNKVLLDTIRYFCGTFMRSPYMAMPRVIKVLSNAYEFNPSKNKEVVSRPSDNTELLRLVMQIPIFTIFRNAIVGSPCSVKARALIYAHLERFELPAQTLHMDRQYIVKNCPRLLDEMINSLLYVLAIAMDEAGARQKTPQHLATIENCMRLMPMLIQALSDNASPLLQLPHIGPTQLRYMMSKQRNIKSIKQLVRLPDDKRRSLLRSLSDEQYRDVLNVCASMPLLEITYRCEVMDDDDPSVWPLSMVTTTVLLKRHPLFEPSRVTTSGTGFSELSSSYVTGGNGGSAVPGATAQPDWSTYSQSHSPDSRLYTAADINAVADTRAMVYGDFTEEDMNSTGKSKKGSNTPVWDKNKRKRPVRKTNKQHRKPEPSKQLPSRTGDTPGTVKGCTHRELDGAATNYGGSDIDDADEGLERFHATLDNESSRIGEADNSEIREPDDSVHTKSDSNAADVGGRSADIRGTESKASRNRDKSFDEKPHCTHMAHCPYFPVEKFEGWWIYLVDRKTRQLITRPLYIGTLQTEEEIPLRFVAPSSPGSYFYTLCVRSDSYVDCDFFETIRLTVSPLPERIVRYLKEQEEEHTDSSTSQSDWSDREEEDEENCSAVPHADAEDDKTHVDDDDDEDEMNGDIDQEQLSAYLAKM